MPWSWAGFANPEAAASDYFASKREKRVADLEMQQLDKELKLKQKYSDEERARVDKDELDALTTTAIEHPRMAIGETSMPAGLNGEETTYPGIKEPAFTTARFQQAARKSMPAISASGDVAQMSGNAPYRKGIGSALGKAEQAGATYREKLALSGLSRLPSETGAAIAQNNSTIQTSPFTTARTIADAEHGVSSAELGKLTNKALIERGAPEIDAFAKTSSNLLTGAKNDAELRVGLPTSDATTAKQLNDLRNKKARVEGIKEDARTESEIREDEKSARAVQKAIEDSALQTAEKSRAIAALNNGILRKASKPMPDGTVVMDKSKLTPDEADVLDTILGIMKASSMGSLYDAEFTRRIMSGRNAGGPVGGYSQRGNTTATPAAPQLGNEE